MEGENLAEVNVIKANIELEIALKGKQKNVTELRDGCLLVEIANENQSLLKKHLKKLDDRTIEIREHTTLNQVKGTIHYRNRPGYSDEDILNELKSQSRRTIQYSKAGIRRTRKIINLYYTY